MNNKSIVLFLIFLSLFTAQKIVSVDMSKHVESTKAPVWSYTEEVKQRKIDCARYRQLIQDFEVILKQNLASKEFYSGTLLLPIAYFRYFVGYDRSLIESDAYALNQIQNFKKLLSQNYCTDVE